MVERFRSAPSGREVPMVEPGGRREDPETEARSAP
jgi:hypothetical protein